MKLHGKIEIAAPAAAVWALVNDPISLAGCVPGVQEVVKVDDRTFNGAIKAAVGPVESTFAFTSVITRSDFPGDLQVEMTGVDSMTNSKLVTSVVASLESPEPGATVLIYSANVQIKGRLAILGEMVLRATASVMIGELVKCLRSRLEAPTTSDGAPT
jgi:carbon monoxide dehydrogenase subunit G